MGKCSKYLLKAVEEKMKKDISRELWPDLIRVFAIYCVVILHTIYLYPNWISNYIFKISETCIPLFVMLSGALLLSKTESYKVFFQKRCAKVLFPWIVWTLVYMTYYYLTKTPHVINDFFSDNSISKNSQWIRFFIVELFSGLWFLPLIFSLYLLTPMLRIFVNNAKRIDVLYILVIWFIVIILMPVVWPGSLFPKWEANLVFAPIQYSGYFILGYYLIKNKKSKIFNLPLWAIIPILIIFVLLPITGFLDPATFIGAVMLFIYFVSLSSRKGDRLNVKLKNIIASVAKASLGIYVIHAFLIFIFERYLISILNLSGNGFLFTFIIFSLSAVIVIILQKIPIIRIIVP